MGHTEDEGGDEADPEDVAGDNALGGCDPPGTSTLLVA
jgi:hypothetical protein